MICPYLPCNYVIKTLKDPDNSKVLYETKTYTLPECLKEKCPFYAVDDREYIDGTCIKAEKEKYE